MRATPNDWYAAALDAIVFCRISRPTNVSDTTTARNFFEALLKLRERVEPKGWRLVCYEASRNVWPSGMCRDMGLGLKAYRLEMGIDISSEDLVEIFSYGADVIISTVAEQRAFREEWAGRHGTHPGVDA